MENLVGSSSCVEGVKASALTDSITVLYTVCKNANLVISYVGLNIICLK